MASSYFCVSVAVNNSKTLVPWTVVSPKDDLTFLELFMKIKSGAFDVIVVSEEMKGSVLKQALVGESKTSLNVISPNDSVKGVSSVFGSFMKFLVELQQPQSHDNSQSVPQRNAFEVMMAAQRQLDAHECSGVPVAIPQRTRKDKLHNDLLELMVDLKLKWRSPSTDCTPFIKKLTNLLWYIDGHYDTLEEKSSPIPDIFRTFQGYNCPETSKHRKRLHGNLRREELSSHVLFLQEAIHASWMQRESFKQLRDSIEGLKDSISGYASYLLSKAKYQRLHHLLTEPSANPTDNSTTRFIQKTSHSTDMLHSLNQALLSSSSYQPLCLGDFMPPDRRKRYTFVKEVEKGLLVPSVLFTYTPGGGVLNHHFIWRVPESFDVDAALGENQRVIGVIKAQLPIFHTRAMKQNFVNMYGRLSSSCHPYMLRDIYRELTGDVSSAHTTDEGDLDKRVSHALENEDVDIIIDLRHCNAGRQSKYDEFWERCSEFLQEATAVHERRHGDACFMAKAISVRDLISQVAQKCSEGTPIPSESWVKYNFCPRNPRIKSSAHYTGRLKVKRQVQRRLFRKEHVNGHYCAALYRYLREFAIMYRDISNFVSIDDKHRIKVGEPGFPLAAVERGKEVIVSLDQTFVVGDHDFAKLSLIPSVSLMVTIPDSFQGSWYEGQVFIGFKDAVFKSSSPIRHATELYRLLLTRMGEKSILLMYSDGGPDHRLTFISVQLSLIALFLNLNLDVLIACRTAPNNSWRNPVERVMSIVNLGLQCIGIMRSKVSDDFEEVIKNCNSLKSCRTSLSSMASQMDETLAPTIELLHNLMKRLELKGQAFEVFDSATDDQIQSFWEILLVIDSALRFQDTTKRDVEDKEKLKEFFEHCCVNHHYSFQIKKCGNSSCGICKPVRMDSDRFASLNFLPLPVPTDDGHYRPFEEVYGKKLTEEHRPSLKVKRQCNSIGFYASQQHAKNVNVVVQCEECDLWRLLFCRHKLTIQERSLLQTIFEDVSYSCGAALDELDLPGRLEGVCVKAHTCNDPMEKLYYSCGFETVCYYCGTLIEDIADFFPQCELCLSKPKVARPKPK